MEKSDRMIDVMLHVCDAKKLARECGLKAEYVPVAAVIEISYDGIPIGVSFDGFRVKDMSNNQTYVLARYMKAFKSTDFLNPKN